MCRPSLSWYKFLKPLCFKRQVAFSHLIPPVQTVTTCLSFIFLISFIFSGSSRKFRIFGCTVLSICPTSISKSLRRSSTTKSFSFLYQVCSSLAVICLAVSFCISNLPAPRVTTSSLTFISNFVKALPLPSLSLNTTSLNSLDLSIFKSFSLFLYALTFRAVPSKVAFTPSFAKSIRPFKFKLAQSSFCSSMSFLGFLIFTNL